MTTEPGKLNDTKVSFQMNHASISGTLMATYMVDTVPINAVFQSVLSNNIVAKHQYMVSGVILYDGPSNLIGIEGNLQ